MKWPPDYTKEFNRRFKLWNDIRQMREKSLADWLNLRAFYAENPVNFINDFCVTYNPRNKSPLPKIVPFVLFPRQIEFIECLRECVDDGESMLCEKSRDMGASWLCCAFSVHQWIFKEGTSIGFGSKDLVSVDNLGDLDSILEKIRLTIEYLPDFFKPQNYNPQKHAVHKKITNPENTSQIVGQGGDNIGRGGRSTMYFKDEAAHYERPDKIEAALGDNTDVQIDISSVNGANNVFYRRRHAGQIWKKGHSILTGVTRVFIMDWRDHPLKDQKWYDRRREKAEREGLLAVFAQEVDRDYLSSVEGIIIQPKWVKAAIDAHIKLGIDDDGERVGGLDVADEGLDKNSLAIRHGVILKYCEDWGKGDTGETTRKAVLKCKEMRVSELFYDSIGVGAGVKSESNRLREEDKDKPKDEQVLGSLRVLPWNAGANPINPEKNIIEGDYQSPKNKDYFENLSAQAYWLLAQRFYKTYLAVTLGREYSHDELISLPSDLPQLQEIIVELSQATQTASKKGKMMINKKPTGTKSPNLADSIKQCYCPIRKGVDYSKLTTM